MRKLLNKPWFVAVLAVLAIALIARSLLPSRVLTTAGGGASTSDEPTESAVAVETTPPAPSSPGAIRAALNELAIPASLRDPFASKTKAVAVTVERVPEPDISETLRVSAIWIQDGSSYVLANQHIYKIGDRVGRCTLESANRDGVWVSHWKGRDFVAIGTAFTLTTPARQAAGLSLSNGG